MTRILKILLFAVLLAACHESDTYQLPPKEQIDSRYFPLDSGAWRDFDVVEINIDAPIALYDTLHYVVREQFGGIFIDNLGDTLRQIERFRRQPDSDQWQRLNTWTAYVKDAEVIQIEENMRYLKMQLPLYAGKTWNGNTYNHTDTLQQFKYRVDSIDCQMNIGGFSFDSVLTISQKNELTAISKILVAERYALGVGMVQKMAIDIYSDTYAPDSDIEKRVTQGTLVYYTLLNYGK